MELIARIGIILAIILAAVLAICLLVLILILIVPAVYKGHDEYKEDKFKSDFDLKWLLGAVWLHKQIGDERESEIRILGHRLHRNVKNDDESNESHDDSADKNDEKDTNSGEENDKLTLKKIINVVNDSYNELKKEENKRLLNLIKEVVIKLIKHAFPKKLTGYVHFGCESPADTGMMLAKITWLFPLFGDSFKVRPDFENKCLDGEADIEGKIGIGYCLFTAGRVWFNKDFRRFLCQIKSRN